MKKGANISGILDEDNCFICGIKQKELPKGKFYICRECNHLLCNNCKGRHDDVHPDHNVITSYVSGEINDDNKGNLKSKPKNNNHYDYYKEYINPSNNRYDEENPENYSNDNYNLNRNKYNNPQELENPNYNYNNINPNVSNSQNFPKYNNNNTIPNEQNYYQNTPSKSLDSNNPYFMNKNKNNIDNISNLNNLNNLNNNNYDVNKNYNPNDNLNENAPNINTLKSYNLNDRNNPNDNNLYPNKNKRVPLKRYYNNRNNNNQDDNNNQYNDNYNDNDNDNYNDSYNDKFNDKFNDNDNNNYNDNYNDYNGNEPGREPENRNKNPKLFKKEKCRIEFDLNKKDEEFNRCEIFGSPACYNCLKSKKNEKTTQIFYCSQCMKLFCRDCLYQHNYCS